MKKMSGKSISPHRIDAFCAAFIQTFNATSAAISAGYSENGAGQQGSALMKLPAVQERLKALMDERLGKLNVSKESVLDEIAAISFSNMAEYASWGREQVEIGRGKKKRRVLQNFIRLNNSSDLDCRAVQSVKETETGISIKLHDKNSGLMVLARHFKLIQGEGMEDGAGWQDLQARAWKAYQERKKNANATPAASKKGS